MSVAIVAVTRIFANVIDLKKSKALLYFFAGSQKILPRPSLREKCPDSELFWSAFSRIWTEYGEIRSVSPYSVRMREIADQNTPNTDTFYAVRSYGVLLCGFLKDLTKTMVSLRQ